MIVWAASYHTCRGVARHRWLTEKDGSLKREAKYAKTVTFGGEVCKVMGADVYSVAFTAAKGEWKLMQNKEAVVKLAAPRTGSLEDMMTKAGFDNAFLDLKTPAAGGEWLGKRRWVMRPMGYADMEALWPRSFDGVIFTKTMTPSEAVEGERPVQVTAGITAGRRVRGLKVGSPVRAPADRAGTRRASDDEKAHSTGAA